MKHGGLLGVYTNEDTRTGLKLSFLIASFHNVRGTVLLLDCGLLTPIEGWMTLSTIQDVYTLVKFFLVDYLK